MSKGQWTVVGLLIVLASLEIIRSGAVQGFFQGFFGQFGVSSGSSSATSSGGPSGGTSPATQTFRGMPSGKQQIRGPN